MNIFNFPLIIKGQTGDLDDLILDTALIAHGLLGKVDTFWSQDVRGERVIMNFLHQQHRDAFNERWQTLVESDWYRSDEEENEVENCVAEKYKFEAILPFKLFADECGRICDAFEAYGFEHTANMCFENIAIQSIECRLVELAAQCGVVGFDVAEQYEGGEDTPFILSFSDQKDIGPFVVAARSSGIL